jgi:hypothetical protein
MKARKDFSKTLYLFDLDETLVSHDSEVLKIYVRDKDCNVLRSLTNKEYNIDILKESETYDFSEFRSSFVFSKSASPIPDMIKKLKKIHKKNKNVEILTARSDFDDKEHFSDMLSSYGIDIKEIHVRRAGNIDAKSTGEAKSIFVSTLIEEYGYEKIHLYDDSISNLMEFLKLKTNFDNVEFHAHLVNCDHTTGKVKVKRLK